MDEKEMVLQHIHEELNDVHAYMDAYHKTKNGIFKDLAHEEMSHAMILESIYKKHGGSMDDTMHEFGEAEKALNN